MGDEAATQGTQGLLNPGTQVAARPLAFFHRLFAPLLQPTLADLAVLGEEATGMQSQPECDKVRVEIVLEQVG
ncbi:hypothetical protein FQZ97_938280 [compost metagenome]